jgi:hypothetical protein
MRGAVAIRTSIRRGGQSVAFTDAPPGSRPSFLPPRTTIHPNPSAANRESACSGGPTVPFTGAPPDFRPSVRPSFLPPSPTRHSNRESRRSDFHPTQPNQSTLRRSNRENKRRSQLAINPSASRALKPKPSKPVRGLRCLVRARFQPCRNRHRINPASAAEGMSLPSKSTHRLESGAPNSNLHPQIPNSNPPKKPKNTKNHPQSLFRLERTPTVYFHQLTRNLNEPMFRLEREKVRRKNEAKIPENPPSPQRTSNFNSPAV